MAPVGGRCESRDSASEADVLTIWSRAARVRRRGFRLDGRNAGAGNSGRALASGPRLDRTSGRSASDHASSGTPGPDDARNPRPESRPVVELAVGMTPVLAQGLVENASVGGMIAGIANGLGSIVDSGLSWISSASLEPWLI